MAFGSTARGAALRLGGLRSMRALGEVRIARRGSLVATAWAGPRRVLAVVVTPGCCGAGDTIVAAVDSGRRRVVWRQRLEGSLQAGSAWAAALLVLGPRGRSIGPSRIVEVGAGGQTRSAELPEIRSGTESSAARAGGGPTRSWNPGLAVDGAGARAFVVQAQGPVAELDLATFQVRWHAHHTYSTYDRGVEQLMGTFRMLDLAPLGRNEEEPAAWWHRHDEYEDTASGDTA